MKQMGSQFFDEQEWAVLEKAKNGRSWRKFILDCAKEDLKKRGVL